MSSSKKPVPTTESGDLTQEDIWTQAEGGVVRNTPLNSTNDQKLEGTKAIPNRETSPPVAVQAKDHHVGIMDKVKGQLKIAQGVLKHDPNLTQEGEILKADGEAVTLGKPHMEAEEQGKRR